MNRPLVPVTLALIAGIVTADKVPNPFIAGAVMAAGGALLWLLMKRQPLLLLLFACLGYLAFTAQINMIPPNHVMNLGNDIGGVKAVTLQVVDLPEENEERVYFTGEVKSASFKGFDKQGLCGRVRVTLEKSLGFRPEYGDILTIKGRLKLPEGPKNPGEFNYPQYLRYQKVRYTLYAKDSAAQKEGNAGNPFILACCRLKAKLVSVIYACLPLEEAKVLEGLMLGNTRALSDETYDRFKITGTAHILAVSGMNVGLIGLFVFLLLKLFGAPRKVCAAVTLILLCFFAVITGMDSSIVRATIMGAFVLFGYLIERDADVINSLAAAAFFILLFSPADLFGAGFQLSFLATLGLVYFDGWSRQVFKKAPDNVVRAVAPTITAQLFIIPVMANTFHQVSLISVIANIFIVPISSAITILGFTMWMAGSVWIEAGRIFGASIWVLIRAMMWVTDMLAKVPYAALSVRGMGAGLCGLYYLMFILLPHGDILAGSASMRSQIRTDKGSSEFGDGAGAHPHLRTPNPELHLSASEDTYHAGYTGGKGIGLRTILWTILGLCCLLHLFWPGRPGVYVLATKGINAAYVHTTGHRDILMLGCDDGKKAAGMASAVLPFLRYMGVNRIGTLMATGVTERANIDKVRSNIMTAHTVGDGPVLRAPAGGKAVIMTAGQATATGALPGDIIIPCYFSGPVLRSLAKVNVVVINTGNAGGFRKPSYDIPGVWDVREKGCFVYAVSGSEP